MSAPYSCEDCARPMYSLRNGKELCASCEEKREQDMKKKYSKR
jgi:uncharacterized Zn finger protein (UPF0148 family)